jgi:hypothetical protein
MLPKSNLEVLKTMHLRFPSLINDKECREYLESHGQTKLMKEPTMTLHLTPKLT